mgnify:CR=1 FL=1
MPPINNVRTHDKLVGLGRLELPTSRLSGVRSNQLSYRPVVPEGQQFVFIHLEEMRGRR